MAAFEALAWDSDFFGFGVARIPPASDRGALAAALQAARSADVRLAYWLPPASAQNSRAAESLGGSLIGEQVRYERLANSAIDAEDVRAYACHESADALIPLAHQAAAVSRFCTDPCMPVGAAKRMYEIWIRRSVAREIADVFVAPARGEVEGMITVGRQDHCAVVGILAVHASQRRRGRGRALIGAALRQAQALGLSRLRVATQADNRAACALYEACGFERAQTTLVVHFWLTSS